MGQRLIAVRGAVTVSNTGDERKEMQDAVAMLVDDVVDKNFMPLGDIVSIQFTQTPDLRTTNAAAALRKARPAYADVPLFCSQEPVVEGMMPRVVRVLITGYGASRTRPSYLKGARALRPDLAD